MTAHQLMIRLAGVPGNAHLQVTSLGSGEYRMEAWRIWDGGKSLCDQVTIPSTLPDFDDGAMD